MSSSDFETTKEMLELGSTENTRPHPEEKNKKLALHRQGKLEVRRTRAQHPVGADTGKTNDQTKNFNNSRVKTDTPASSNTTPLRHKRSRDIRDRQGDVRATVSAEGSQELKGHPEGQPKNPKLKTTTKKQPNETKRQSKDCSS